MVKFLSLFNISSGMLADAIVSPKSGFVTFFETIGNIFLESILIVYELLVKLVYLVAQFMMIAIDFVFVFIRQLTGINTDFSDIENLEESDIIFKFLFSEPVTDALKGILAIAIVLIILFSIIAILRTEYAAATLNANNAKGKILSGALKSLMLIILVPVLVIGSIFLSNAVLASLYNATSGGNETSMATQVFMASTYQANQYRKYATQDLKIPITYNWSEVKEDENISDWATDGSIAEMEEAYAAFRNSSVWNRGWTTYLMFTNNTFVSYDDIEEADRIAAQYGTVSNYHDSFDEGLFNKKVEYYQMAEVVDYAMRNHETLYFKTPQDIYSSWTGVPVDIEYTNLFYRTANGIGFNIKYSSETQRTEYNSVNNSGTQDEADGSVFLVCKRQEEVVYGYTRSYYVPLLAGIDMQSSYTDGTNVIVARGLFDDGGYPTAIREENNQIICYRDKLNVPYIADFLPKISYELPEGTTQSIGSFLIKEGIHAITGVDPDDYIPYVYFNFDVFNLFSKTNQTVATLDGGSFYINYTFSCDDVVYTNFYDYRETNIVILVFCASLLIGMLFKAAFGAATRLFSVVLLFVSYPAVCATMPLDNGGRFKKWVGEFTNELLSVYGVVIGLNIVLLLHPIIDSLNIFTPMDFELAYANGIIPESWSAEFVNFLLETVFLFVSFTLFQTAIKVISSVLGVGTDVIARGDDAIGGAKKIIKKSKDVVTGKVVVDAAKGAVDTAKGFIPGSAIVHDLAESNKFYKETIKPLKDTAKELSKSVNSGDKKDTELKTGTIENMKAKK